MAVGPVLHRQPLHPETEAAAPGAGLSLYQVSWQRVHVALPSRPQHGPREVTRAAGASATGSDHGCTPSVRRANLATSAAAGKAQTLSTAVADPVAAAPAVCTTAHGGKASAIVASTDAPVFYSRVPSTAISQQEGLVRRPLIAAERAPGLRLHDRAEEVNAAVGGAAHRHSGGGPGVTPAVVVVTVTAFTALAVDQPRKRATTWKLLSPLLKAVAPVAPATPLVTLAGTGVGQPGRDRRSGAHRNAPALEGSAATSPLAMNGRPEAAGLIGTAAAGGGAVAARARELA